MGLFSMARVGNVDIFFVECNGDHRDLHVLTHSFPTRRSSDLTGVATRPVDLETYRRSLAQKNTRSAQVMLPVFQGARGTRTRIAYGEGEDERVLRAIQRSEEHTSELQSLMRISSAVFCLKKKTNTLNPPCATFTATSTH